jgi:dihydrofolate reductase
VMGRRSYEQMLTFGPSPWDGKRTIVMTSRPLGNAAAATSASAEPAEAIADRLAAETTHGDVWVFGGGEVARAFLDAGRLDTLELCVVPHLIGQGIPLFGGGTPPSNLRLTRSRQYPNGLVCLDYDVLR